MIDDIITYNICDVFAKSWMCPNTITILNLVPSILSIYFLIRKKMLFFWILLIIRIILDCLDGHVARKYNKISQLGGELDGLFDLCYYTVLLYCILKINGISYRMIILWVILFMTFMKLKPQPFFDIIKNNSLLSIPSLIYLIRLGCI